MAPRIIRNGYVQASVYVLVLPGAIPVVHDDLSDIGGEDIYGFKVPGASVELLVSLYEPWAINEGFELYNLVEGLCDCFLFFRRADGFELNAHYYSSRNSEAPTFCIGLLKKGDAT